MNRYVNAEATYHTMNLIQLGAEVKTVSGKMVYVKFKLPKGLEVSYVYHINKNNHYFLERIKPYPLPIKEIDTAEDVIRLIQIDFEQFSTAIESSKVDEFVEINREMHQAMKSFEDLFLYFNIDNDTIKTIHKHIKDIHNTIEKAAKSSERLYFGKEPDNL